MPFWLILLLWTSLSSAQINFQKLRTLSNGFRFCPAVDLHEWVNSFDNCLIPLFSTAFWIPHSLTCVTLHEGRRGTCCFSTVMCNSGNMGWWGRLLRPWKRIPGTQDGKWMGSWYLASPEPWAGKLSAANRVAESHWLHCWELEWINEQKASTKIGNWREI